ncbi:MAG: hypothetical protein Kow0063_39780 [Anaerolineae bacterium]
MKKQTRIVTTLPISTSTLITLTLTLILALTLTLTACNIAPGGAGEERAESLQPLDPAAWPTPQPTPTQASPTPFPKITLAPTPTPTPRPATPGATTSSPAGQESLTFSGDMGELVEQVTRLSGGFPPTAAAIITADNVAVRQGPAGSASPLGAPQPGELAAILGTNASGDWYYVLTRSGLQGWLPATALQITFSLAEAPVLPDDPTSQGPPSSPGTANLLAELEPVAVALVTAGNGIPVRQGPAASYPAIGTAAQGEMGGIFGTNPARNWLYIYTISGTNGWVPADAVRIIGSLEGAAVLSPDAIAASPSQGELPSSSPTAFPTSSAAGIQPLDFSTLAPVARARVDNQGLNVRQGPGAAYEKLGHLLRDDEVEVLALNKTEEWALVRTAAGDLGWVSLDYLAIDGSLEAAPRIISSAPDRNLPPGQVAPAFSMPSGAGNNATSGSAGPARPGSNTSPVEQQSSSNASPLAHDLAPMAKARPNRPDVKLFRGPAATYEPIVSLSQDETVSLLGLDQQGQWALVEPADSRKSPGWANLLDLTLEEGSLAGAPRLMTAWVESNELTIRRGPGLFHEPVGRLGINSLVIVLGLNEGRSWALVQPVKGEGGGWIPINFLTLSGSWADVPLAPQPAPVTRDAPSQETSRNAGLSTTRPGQLVLQTSSGGDIMVINPDGSGLRRLTHGIDPALSPDGQTVAFTRWTGEDGALWLIDIDGRDERPVLGGTKQAKHPAWSPDGGQIVINFQHGGRLDPKQVCENLIELGDRQPDIPWNVDPDSVEVKLIDFIPHLCWVLPPDPHWGLRIVDVASGSFQDMPSDAYAFGPEWDPLNPWRVVSSGLNGLVQLDVNRNEQWALTDRREDRTPVFSPDGRYIAVAFNNHGHYDIHRLNSDGSGRVALTRTPLWVTAQPGENRPWNNVSPAWSPDGSQIAFLTDRNGRWEVWVMNADGSNQRPMFPDEVNDQLQIDYDFVDERVLSWR